MADKKKAVRAGDIDFPKRYAKRESSIVNAVDPSKKELVKRTFHAQSEDVERVITKYQKGVDSGKIKAITSKGKKYGA